MAPGAGSAVIRMDGTPIRAGQAGEHGEGLPLAGARRPRRGRAALPGLQQARERGEVPRRLRRNPGDGRPSRLRGLCRGPRRRGHPPDVPGPCGTRFRGAGDTHPEMAGAALDLTGAVHRTGSGIGDRTPAGRLAAPRHPVRRAIAHPTERWAAPGTFPGTPARRRTRTPAGTRRVR